MAEFGSVVLGRRYRDVVTGYEGVATSATLYLNGCRRIGLEKLDKDGNVKGYVFDEPNLVQVSDGTASVLDEMTGAQIAAAGEAVRTGGPHDHESVLDTH